MAEALSPRLDQLSELTKRLNSTTDRIGHIVQGVEARLNSLCGLGMEASVEIDCQSNSDEDYTSTKSLMYGRHGGKYRIFVAEFAEHCGNLVSEPVETLWANCPRDVKLAAFGKLPELLDKLIAKVSDQLTQVEINAQELEAILPPKTKKKEATS